MWVPDRGNSGIMFDLRHFSGDICFYASSDRVSYKCKADEDSLFVMQKNGIMKVFNLWGLWVSVNTACKEVSGFEYIFGALDL